MKTLILYHRGPNFPVYVLDNIEHIRKLHNNNIKIYFLTDSRVPIDGVELIDITEFPAVPLKNPDPNHSGFWMFTLLRFFDVAHFLKVSGLKDVCLIENDVLLFSKLEDMPHNPERLCTVQDSEFRAIVSILFIPDYERLVPFLVHVLQQQKTFICNDMIAWGTFGGKQCLPTLPGIDGIYDGAAIGQWLDGCHVAPGIAFLNETADLKCNEHVFTFRDNRIYMDNCRIHNIHLHSKRLKLFLEKVRMLSEMNN